MISQEVIEVRLTRIGFEEKLLIIVLFRLMAVDQTFGIIVPLTGSSANHLQHIRYRIIHVSLLLSVVSTSVHYHHTVRLHCQIPRQFISADYYLD
jgi:hypothetical protein